MLTDICGNGNGEQLELNACMLAPATVLIRQPPTVVRKRSRMAITNSNWTTNFFSQFLSVLHFQSLDPRKWAVKA